MSTYQSLVKQLQVSGWHRATIAWFVKGNLWKPGLSTCPHKYGVCCQPKLYAILGNKTEITIIVLRNPRHKNGQVSKKLRNCILHVKPCPGTCDLCSDGGWFGVAPQVFFGQRWCEFSTVNRGNDPHFSDFLAPVRMCSKATRPQNIDALQNAGASSWCEGVFTHP